MIREEDVYKIGHLSRTHGVKGEIIFKFNDDVFDRVGCDYLILQTEGMLVPFFIEEYRFQNESEALIKFEDVDTQEKAADIVDSDVFFPRTLSDAQNGRMPSFASVVGYVIIDGKTGEAVGKIEDLDESTINTLFCVEGGILIPAHEELVCKVDETNRTITMTLPDGLLSNK